MPDQHFLSLEVIRLATPNNRAIDGTGFSFLFPRSGAGKFASGPALYTLLPGEVLVLNNGKRGKLSVVNAAELVLWYFTARVEDLFPLFNCEEICHLEEIESTFKSPRLYAASSPVAKDCHQLLAEVPPRLGVDHRGQLLRVVTAILSAEFKNLLLPGLGPTGSHMKEVFKTLSVTEIVQLSVDELADRFDCSRRQLNRLFHRHFGISVSALRMEMRLLRAISLLRDPKAKVFQVADECGFNHLGLFSACFKKRFKVSPGQWRKTVFGAGVPSTEAVLKGISCRIQGLGLCPLSADTFRTVNKAETTACNRANGGTTGAFSCIARSNSTYEADSERLTLKTRPQL